jgi:hypothetical protein
MFDVPVTLFFYKRVKKTLRVFEEIAKVKPKKIYLISDGPKDKSETPLVEECRYLVEKKIDWSCDVVRDYSAANSGVYNRIGLGAINVLRIENRALFLEDDCLPEQTFFRFSEEMLERYAHDTRVLWVCGTSYLRNFRSVDGSSYVFTRLMLPCGWATWSDKFLKFYDGNLELFDSLCRRDRIEFGYYNSNLFNQDMLHWRRERNLVKMGRDPISWDYQMAFALRANSLFGIAPTLNQIRNIGVDHFSAHGGSSFSNIMTRRFCEVDTLPLHFPLKHPKSLMIDKNFEEATEKLIVFPFIYRLLSLFSRIVKYFFGIKETDRLSAVALNWLRIKK